MAHSACRRSLAAWLDPWENWPHKTFGVQPCWKKPRFNHHQGSIYCPPANRLHINTQSHVSLFWLLEAVLLTQDGFKLTILLTWHPRYWDYKRVPLHQFTTLLLTVGKLGAFSPLLPNQIRRSLSSLTEWSKFVLLSTIESGASPFQSQVNLLTARSNYAFSSYSFIENRLFVLHKRPSGNSHSSDPDCRATKTETHVSCHFNLISNVPPKQWFSPFLVLWPSCCSYPQSKNYFLCYLTLILVLLSWR